MKVELTPRRESHEVDREARREVVERLVKRGEIEVVTAASGTVLYIPQRLDEYARSRFARSVCIRTRNRIAKFLNREGSSWRSRAARASILQSLLLPN